LLAIGAVQQVEQADIDGGPLGQFHPARFDGLAGPWCAACFNRVHNEITRSIEQHRERIEALFHGVCGDGRSTSQQDSR